MGYPVTSGTPNTSAVVEASGRVMVLFGTARGLLKWVRRGVGLAGVVASLMGLVPAGLSGQVLSTGAIAGHVRGPGGIAVPGATVLLTEPQTGERKLTWTDGAGNYILTALHPGTYKLETSLVGFRTDVREPVPVTAGKTLTVNVSLVIAMPESAGAEAAPNPAAGSGMPQTGAAQMPARTGFQGMDRMPMEGTTGNGEGSNIRFAEGAPSGGSPEGEITSAETDPAASAANSFLLSGGTGITAATPGGDESRMRGRFQEFRERMQGQSAPGFGGGGGPMEMGPMGPMGGGRGGGDWTRRRAQINRIRGNVSEQYSNSVLNARPYPLNVTSSPQIPSYTERLGIAFGGPLSIPKIYHGKDKTSFFLNYQMQRGKTPVDSFATVPTAAERGGDFSRAAIASGPLAGTVPTIYDPLSNPLGPRTPFAGNQIPSSRFASAAVGLLKFIPLPNLPGLVQNFHLQETLPNSSDRIMARLGHQISAKDNFNVMYFFNSARSESVSSYPALTSHTTVRGQNVNLGETHTFGPHLVNNLMVNFNRQRSYLLNPFAFQQNVAGELGIQGVSADPQLGRAAHTIHQLHGTQRRDSFSHPKPDLAIFRFGGLECGKAQYALRRGTEAYATEQPDGPQRARDLHVQWLHDQRLHRSGPAGPQHGF
jgi:hypothetical protein